MVPKSMVQVEQASSQAAHGHEDWDPDWVTELFHCRAKCEECNELLFVVGKTSLEADYDDDAGLSYASVFHVDAVVPPPPMLLVPDLFPKLATAELEKAFGLFWSDRPASLNRLRCSLERLCDHEKVPKFVKNKEGERRPANLHQRIEKLPGRFDSVRSALLALKWLGNDGTHGGEADVDDVLDALQLLDFIFTGVYINAAKEIAAMAKAINKKKGSRHKRKKG